MRRILIDHARARGGRAGQRVANPDSIRSIAELAASDPDEILAVDAAVSRLEETAPDAAALVRLRFYAGLTVDEAARALETSPRSAARLWSYARAALFRAVSNDT
ncbi:MAG: ECF-type sigma factor, partial [Planctomycetota bacterium]